MKFPNQAALTLWHGLRATAFALLICTVGMPAAQAGLIGQKVQVQPLDSGEAAFTFTIVDDVANPEFTPASTGWTVGLFAPDFIDVGDDFVDFHFEGAGTFGGQFRYQFSFFDPLSAPLTSLTGVSVSSSTAGPGGVDNGDLDLTNLLGGVFVIDFGGNNVPPITDVRLSLTMAQVNGVPEPTSLALVGVALLGLVAVRRRGD